MDTLINNWRYFKEMNKNEKEFEDQLKYVAPLCGMKYYKIPDIKYAGNKSAYGDKRPFDAILVTPNGNYCIEAKYQYNKLEVHQAINEAIINDFNDSFFVLRKKKLKKGDVFSVEKYGKVVWETDKIENLLNYFKEN